MHQNQQLKSDQGFVLRLLRIFPDQLVYLFYLVSLLIALGDDGTIVLQQRCLLTVFDKAGDPAFGLGGHLIVDALDLVKKACLCDSRILLEIRLCHPRDLSDSLAELFLMC